jgi:hypothetical protein
MTSKAKTKGNSWERDIANHLTELYGEKFIRAQGSGAFVGGNNSFRRKQLDESQTRAFKGDVVPPSDWIHFNCEAKNYGIFPFHQLVQAECKQLETWLGQLIVAADPGDLNILIIKITRKGKYVIVPKGTHWHNGPHIQYYSPRHNYWQIFDYDFFWKHNHSIVKTLSLKK